LFNEKFCGKIFPVSVSLQLFQASTVPVPVGTGTSRTALVVTLHSDTHSNLFGFLESGNVWDALHCCFSLLPTKAGHRIFQSQQFCKKEHDDKEEKCCPIARSEAKFMNVQFR
jgi:hypothetical protein